MFCTFFLFSIFNTLFSPKSIDYLMKIPVLVIRDYFHVVDWGV